MRRDKCCGRCRTPFDVCALKRECRCHGATIDWDDIQHHIATEPTQARLRAETRTREHEARIWQAKQPDHVDDDREVA